VDEEPAMSPYDMNRTEAQWVLADAQIRATTDDDAGMEADGSNPEHAQAEEAGVPTSSGEPPNAVDSDREAEVAGSPPKLATRPLVRRPRPGEAGSCDLDAQDASDA
jgi:hypothetical protein